MNRYRISTDAPTNSTIRVTAAEFVSNGQYTRFLLGDGTEVLRVNDDRVISVALEDTETWVLEVDWEDPQGRPSLVGAFTSKGAALAWGARTVEGGSYSAIPVGPVQ